MTTTKAITSAKITNLTELEAFCEAVRESTKGRHGDEVYLATAVRMTLVTDRLTDGSQVFDISASLVLERNERRG